MTAAFISALDRFLKRLDDAFQLSDIKDSTGELQVAAADLRRTLHHEAPQPGRRVYPVILNVPTVVTVTPLPQTSTIVPMPTTIAPDSTGGRAPSTDGFGGYGV